MSKYLFPLTLLLMIFSYSDFVNNSSVKLDGKITDSLTGAPVSNAHIYIIKGELEAFSNNKGDFSIINPPPTPFTLQIEHNQYNSKLLKVTTTNEKLLIKLSK
ncbi:MAG: carboxypeptidase-like regulatory domain-containing protein [Flavihumibacter sp.]|nr:carboxypeptidase-like regulatory domain-containing protein [Flavihumibacter sp.]